MSAAGGVRHLDSLMVSAAALSMYNGIGKGMDQHCNSIQESYPESEWILSNLT